MKITSMQINNNKEDIVIKHFLIKIIQIIIIKIDYLSLIKIIKL